MLNELSEKQLFNNMELYDENNALFLSATGVSPQKSYCFNYSVEGISTFLPVYIKAYGDSRQEAYDKALVYLMKENAPRRVKLYPKSYPNRCEERFTLGGVVPKDFEVNYADAYSNSTGRVSEEQLAKEKRIEQQFNKVSEKVIGMTPWGAFYGLMIAASRAGEGMFQHKICIDKDGRPVEVGKSVAGRWVKSFIRPAHEYAAEAFSQKKFGQGAVHLLGHGWIINIVKQRRLKKNCDELLITPDEFIQEAKRRGLAPKPRNVSPEESRRRTQADKESIEIEKKMDTISKTGIGLIIAAGLVAGTAITIYAVSKKN